MTGRTVLITGASSGIGARFARIVAAAGGKVVVGARRTERLDELVSEIEANGGEAMAVPLDVAVEASVEAAYDAGEARFGPITGIVANAGITAEGRAIDLPIEEFDRVFATNVRGVFLTARVGARRLQVAGHGAEGRIVLVSSITAAMRTNGLVAYSASKAAVTHMGALLAKEWARSGPNVVTLSPGYIRSELAGDWFDTEGGQRQMARWPRRRLLEEDALDAMLIYLLSDASAGVNGSDFTIDDGQSL
ncbi:SDR family NAD(P)-dependent oxidoreductase [Sphingomonas citricola]|uniref:SDR family NAD(P)-dependent oxidoreductase n=1 Tax=Sphingomonas citricola TaxID=2862498 RepID=UPI0021565B10|nr:SDR family NAD(P)-dependent oxidoreductase [Sphingomonas citricola]